MTVLDLVCRDPRISHVTLIEPDVYKPHNVVRHLFSPAAVGQSKAKLAADWLTERRPDLCVDLLICDLLDPKHASSIEAAIKDCDIGVCAADNEPAKLQFDALMRRYRKPWTLGEVLAGGIGGLVHWFIPGGPCYGCIASFLRRSVKVDDSKPPDYSAPGGPAPETTIPASRASIEVIAALHSQVTLQLLTQGSAYDPGFTSMLFTLEKVPGIFDQAFRARHFRIPRLPDCLVCREPSSLTPLPEGEAKMGDNLDQALDDALTRLNQS
jgi:molybdopterin/thiamine biosynthesis adenylyltransferase